jgi:hypothetical protein
MKNKISKLFFSKCNIVDMVYLMNIHQENLKKNHFVKTKTCFSVFFFLLAKMGFWSVFFLVYLSVCFLLSF